MMKILLEVFAVTLFYLVTDFIIIRALGIYVQRIDWWIGYLQGVVGCLILILIDGVLQ